MVDKLKNASISKKVILIFLGLCFLPITLIVLIFDLLINGFKKKSKKRILLGIILLSLTTFIVIKNIKIYDYDFNHLTYDESIDPIDYIDVFLLSNNGSYLDIKKGFLKDNLRLKNNCTIKLINTSKDAIFEGNIILNNESASEREKRGNIRLNPGEEKEVNINISNSDFTYSFYGGMKKFSENNKYKIISQKIVGTKGEYLRVVIEEPEKFKDKEIVEYFLNGYNNENLIDMIIYIYEKDKEVNIKEMHKGSKYEIIVEKKDSKYLYNLYDIKNNKSINNGEI